MYRFLRILLIWLPLVPEATPAQIKVSGKVFDFSQSRPLEAVSVLSHFSGATITDSLGRYTIIVDEKDSIWFSYLGKSTPRYAVTAIPNISSFDVSLHVNMTQLKEVIVRPRNYHFDSLQNRIEYARAFNFRRPNLETLTSVTPSGVGLDLDEFIRLFQFRRNRRMLAFQERLIQEEQEKFIDYRFNRALIIRLIQLHGAELDSFMKWYRPTLEFTQEATDYEFQEYVKKSWLQYSRYRRAMGELKKEE